MKKLECGPELILIEPAPSERDESVVIMSDEEKKNASKEQNRGTIIYTGDNVVFWRVGDFVSFYKGATTTVRENGIDYLTINKGHVLVRFIEETIEA